MSCEHEHSQEHRPHHLSALVALTGINLTLFFLSVALVVFR